MVYSVWFRVSGVGLRHSAGIMDVELPSPSQLRNYHKPAEPPVYCDRGTSLRTNNPVPGPYKRTMFRAICWP